MLTLDRHPTSQIAVSPAVEAPASPRRTGEDDLAQARAALEARGFTVRLARTHNEARETILSLVPVGAEVHTGASETLAELGITAELERSGRYDPLRPRLWSMDRRTEGREIRKLGAAPDVFLASAQAVTRDGRLVFASATGSQLGPIATGAGLVILPIGAQKIVRDLPAAIRRIEEHSLPREDARSRVAYGRPSGINKLLILDREPMPGRVTVVLIAEPIGF